MQRMTRAVVRSFTAPFRSAARDHALAGGHALFWETAERAFLVMIPPDENNNRDLGYWALLDIDEHYWFVATRGLFRGLATAEIPLDCHGYMRRRAERDSLFRGPKRTVVFDCLACGACCSNNRVEIDDDDKARFDAAGRPELYRAPYARKDDGKIILRLTQARRCRHLETTNACAIYAFRPEACREFPVGSECCLSMREGVGLVDGVPVSRERSSSIRGSR